MYNLRAFRERVRELCARVRKGYGERRATQKDLARAVGLNQTELSNRLNATKGAHLSERDIKAIVLTLVDWGAIDSQAQAEELLSLVDCPTFSAAQWASPRLRKLAMLDPCPTTCPSLEVRTNLPAELSSFVGRRHELAALSQLLTEARLITLSGAGGSGKTRLAMRLGREVVARFAHGVFVVDLSTASDPALLPHMVARELGISEQPGQEPVSALRDALKAKELLLILDNCEQQVATVAALAQGLLSACPHLRLVATSREKLGAEGEVNFQVLPLSLPPHQVKTSIHSLTKYEAVRLFIERASAAAPSFHLAAANVQAVREICERLDGVPLAIELAAAWMNVLDAAEIYARLEGRLRLLVAASPGSNHRHPTIKASLDWSYDLLSAVEQRLLARLAVFNGSFTLAAVEQVCNDENVATEQVFGLLGQLVDKSLVLKSGEAGSLRFTMLEIIREYASWRLEENGEQTTLRQRHALYYLGMAELAGTALQGGGQAEWLATLSLEHDNLRAALGWGIQTQAANLLLRMVSSLWRFWYVHGHLSEGRRWLQVALDMDSGGDTMLRASVLYGAGNLAWSQGEYTAAKRFLTEGLCLCRGNSDASGCSTALSSLGNIAASQGDYPAAYIYYEEGLNIKRQLGDQQGIAAALNNLGTVATMQGNHALAQSQFEESAFIFQQMGNERGVATALNNLGDVLARRGEPGRARALHERSLAIRQGLGDRYGIAAVLHSLGQAAYLEADYPTAALNHAAALRLRQELNDRYGITCSLDAFACLAVKNQQVIRPIRLFSAAERLRSTLGAQLPTTEREERDRALAVAQSSLDAITFASAWAEGERLDFAQAASYALHEDDPSVLLLIPDVSTSPTFIH